ncbi:MAG: hypothetical protein QM628_17425 [Propionicimonas sp.]
MDTADSTRTSGVSSWTAAALGGLLGLAWAAALRGYMTQLVPVSQVDWFGTFVGVLLPGAVTGTLLGVAWARGKAGRNRRIGWFALAPISFAVFPLLEPGAVQALLSQGFGGAATGFALIAIIGGFALSRTGPLWARLLCGALALGFLVALVLASPMVGGPGLALTEPRGVWVAVLVGSLTVLLMLATSVPFRYRNAPDNRR